MHIIHQTVLVTVKGQFIGHCTGIKFLWGYNLHISVSQVPHQQSRKSLLYLLSSLAGV